MNTLHTSRTTHPVPRTPYPVLLTAYCVLLFLLLAPCSSLSAASEAEYGKLSKTYTLNADGSQEYRYNMELTLFTHAAMNRTYGESFIVYNPKFQELKIHSSFTKQKDGTIIKTPDNAFVEVLPRQAADAPDFNYLREMVVVHTGLELGATIYLDYSILSKPGYLPALDICEPIAQTSPVKDYTITIQAPDGKPLAYGLSNVTAKPTVATSNGIKQVTWKLRNLPAASRAPQVSVWGGDVAMLTASGFASNSEALQYLSRQLTPAGNMPASSLAETVTEGKDSDAAKMFAILDHIVDNVGFSRLSLRETGFRIRGIDDVNPSAYGTEAEKTDLLASLLNEAGIKAEIVAAYPAKADINSCGLSAIGELFVLAKAGGKQYLLTPKQKSMPEAGWYAGYAQFVSVSHPGTKVEIGQPATGLSFAYTITLSGGKAHIQSKGTIGDAFVAYTENARTEVSDKTEQTPEEVSGYIILPLPDDPNSIARAAYKSYNTKRTENLLLPYKANESFAYTIELPAGMELSTPETTKTTDNAVGKTTYSVRQSGNKVEVKRTIEIKKQLITPADYQAFRTLVTEFADTNNRQLLIKANP